MYSSAGWPCPSIKFSATYVIRRPTKIREKKMSHKCMYSLINHHVTAKSIIIFFFFCSYEIICLHCLNEVIGVNNRQGDCQLILTKAIRKNCPQEVPTSKVLVCQPIIPARSDHTVDQNIFHQLKICQENIVQNYNNLFQRTRKMLFKELQLPSLSYLSQVIIFKANFALTD